VLRGPTKRSAERAKRAGSAPATRAMWRPSVLQSRAWRKQRGVWDSEACERPPSRMRHRPLRAVAECGRKDGVLAQTKMAVRLALDPGTTDAIPGSRLRPGAPAAHLVHRLRLLPSGPDRVHGSWSRRTQPSTLLTGGCPDALGPQTSIRSGVSRVSGSGDPEPPT
jgi:hypothetical protein